MLCNQQTAQTRGFNKIVDGFIMTMQEYTLSGKTVHVIRVVLHFKIIPYKTTAKNELSVVSGPAHRASASFINTS